MIKALRRHFSAVCFVLLALFIVAPAAQAAPPRDGFVLTQWGRWTLDEGVRSIEQARSVGATHVSIIVSLCQPDKHASTIEWCFDAPGMSLAQGFAGRRLLELLPEIRARGMTFNLIPMMIAEDNSGSRQFINPTDSDAWFRAYGDKMVELAAFARDTGASDFIVASELSILFFKTAGWREVIARVRSVFPGELTISAVVWQYPLIQFWDALDSIGISAYFPLAIFNSLSSIGALELAWYAHKIHLLAFAHLHHKPLMFVEVGYPAMDDAASEPWDYDWAKHERNSALQMRCFEAFRRVWGKDSELRAFQIWGLGVQPPENPKGFTPIGKDSEMSVRRLFSDRSTLSVQ